ncbi:hypothetical protein LSAT2_012703 [Lamellibrachia satsuma]|nr:hypothetical protein LSAT2_012703 [Lamellibrachia satsuma]
MKFAQAEMKELTNLAVITRPKRDSLRLSNRGGKVTSSLDNKITFSTEPNTFEHDEAIAVQMTLPCPTYPGKVTSKGAEKAKMTARKSQNTSKFGSGADNEDVENEVLYLVHKSPKKGWKILPVEVEQPKHDLTQFQLEQPVNSLMVLRTKPTVTGSEAERLARAMEEKLNQKQVIAIVRQSNKDSSDVTVHVVQPVDVEETMKKLSDAGYDDGPACSPAFMLMEGDELEVSFRSNVKSCDAVERLQEIYNSPVSTSINFTVQVDDKYLQKIYPMYQGFVQLFKKEKTSVQKLVKDNDGETHRETVFEYKRVLLCEVLIQIPKDIDLATRSPTTAPVKIIGRRDGLNEELLRHLAHQLDDEWEKLVKHLGVSKTTVNNSKKSVKNWDGSVDDVKFEVLVAWIKTQPREVNTLKDALEKSGDGDLASGLCDMVESFRDNKGQ